MSLFDYTALLSLSTRKIRECLSVVDGAMGCGGALAIGHLPRVSRLSVNYKGDNDMLPEAVHRYPGIYLTAEESPGNPQLGDRR